MSLEWNLNPLLAIGLLLPTWAYAHGVLHLWRSGHTGRGISRAQAAAFSLGMLALAAALISPIDALGHQLLSLHMVQHLLLMLIAAPLLVIGAPPSVFLWVLPLRWRRQLGAWGAHGTPLARLWHALSAPLPAWLLHGAVIWLWHIPGAYEAALVDPLLHALEHVSFFATAVLFWAAALRPQARLLGVLLLFTTALHSSILGALMTFSSAVWYPVYAEYALVWGTTALDDQRIAGLLMWMPGGIIYLAAILWLLSALLMTEPLPTHVSRDFRESLGSPSLRQRGGD